MKYLLNVIVMLNFCCCSNQIKILELKPNLLTSLNLDLGIETKLDTGAAVESAYFKFQDTEYLAYNPKTDAVVKIRNQSTGAVSDLPFDARFFYFMNYLETIWVFYLCANGICAQTSQDLAVWTPVNDGDRVLSVSSGIYAQMWNVAVAVDSDGLFHMLVECSDSKNVGLSYLTADISNNQLNFDTSKKLDFDIPGGGNPEIKIIEGVGLVSIHGQLDDKFNGFWYLTISTLSQGGSVWRTNDKVFAYAKNIHVADPSAIETTEGLKIAFSYDQNSLYTVNSGLTYLQLFDFEQTP